MQNHLELEYSKTNSSIIVSSVELIAYFSQSGLHGELHFSNSKSNPKLVKVKAFLEATLQYSEQSWSWGLYNNPIDYSIVDPAERCKRDRVGRELISFDDKLGYLILPGNESSTWNDVDLNLSGEFYCGNWFFEFICLLFDLQVRMDFGVDQL